MEAVQKSIQKAGSILSIAKNEIEERLRNPKLKLWPSVNLDLYDEILPCLALPSDIRDCQKKYQSKAKDFFANIEKWKNEIGSLETDIKHNQISPQQALQSAKAIEKGATNLGKDIKQIRHMTECLLQSDEQIRNLMNLEAMMQFSKALMNEKEITFNEGFQVSCLLQENDTPQCQEVRLSDLFTTASAIDEKLKNIDVSNLPKIAGDIISFHVSTCRLAIDEIKYFVEKSTNHINHEQKNLVKFTEQFEVLKDAPIDTILKTLAPAAESLYIIMFKLQAHVAVIEKIKLSMVLIRNLNQLHATIKNSLIEEMGQKITAQQSPLNPYTLAYKQASDYFMGLPGMIRSFKLMFKNLGSSSRLNQEELTGKIEDCVSSCNMYFGAKKSDISRMEKYIDGYLGQYSRPFPYDGLFQLMKTTLADYGDRLEKYFHTFPLSSGDGKKAGAGTLGKLVDKIEIRRENLKEPL